MAFTKRETILIVDDLPRNRELLSRIVAREGYRVLEACGAREAIDLALANPPDLILMDVIMPDMDGIECTAMLRGYDETRHIPIIMVTASNERENRIQGIENGANDFVVKPIDSQELMLRIRNGLMVKEYQDFLKTYNTVLESESAEHRAEAAKAQAAAVHSESRCAKNWGDIVCRFARSLEYKQFEHSGHIERMASYVRFLAEKLGMDEETQELFAHAAMLHDVGKLAIPDALHAKTGTLTDDEWAALRAHVTHGEAILGGSDSEVLQLAAEIALNHHECWDGSGYPAGRSGENIPLAARMVMIADVYDTLRSCRPYKDALSHEQVVEVMRSGDAKSTPGAFDPALLALFLEYNLRFAEIYNISAE